MQHLPEDVDLVVLDFGVNDHVSRCLERGPASCMSSYIARRLEAIRSVSHPTPRCPCRSLPLPSPQLSPQPPDLIDMLPVPLPAAVLAAAFSSAA
eukprot:365649-Chlamydomonas_euryale.AAC.2